MQRRGGRRIILLGKCLAQDAWQLTMGALEVSSSAAWLQHKMHLHPKSPIKYIYAQVATTRILRTQAGLHNIISTST